MITVLVVEIGWAAHQLQVESQVQSSTCHFLRPRDDDLLVTLEQ